MITWYLARGAGLAALVLLSLSTALGALGSGGRAAGSRYVLQYVHRAAAGLGLATLALHLVAVLSDSFANVTWTGALVPFTAGYRPQWVALGTVATYLFLGVAALGLARGRLAASTAGARVWRGLHALAYAGWLAALGHGFTSGTDTGVGWVRLLYVLCIAGVAGAVAIRLSTRSKRDADRRLTTTRPLEGAL